MAKRKPIIVERNQKSRRKFAHQHVMKGMDFWKQSSFSNLSVTSPTLQLILQPLRHFAYVTTHSPTLPSLYLRHSSFSYPSVSLPTSQLILQPFRRFTYVTAHSTMILSLFLRERLFTCVTWRAAHGVKRYVSHVLKTLGLGDCTRPFQTLFSRCSLELLS